MANSVSVQFKPLRCVSIKIHLDNPLVSSRRLPVNQGESNMGSIARGAAYITRRNRNNCALFLRISRPSTVFVSTSSSEGDHDDFWSSVKTTATATPAYQEAARPTPNSRSLRNDLGVKDTKLGLYDPRVNDEKDANFSELSRISAGEAALERSSHSWNSSSQGGDPFNGNDTGNSHTEAVFDMSHPTHLSYTRQVRVQRFQGKLLVDIRHFFKEDNGTIRPTTKGISLTVRQYERLKACLDVIDGMLRDSSGPSDSVQ